MKKTLLAVLGLVASMSLLTACDLMESSTSTDSTSTSSSSSEHEHSWESTWSKDDANHWHACTGEDCDEKQDSAAHSGGTATCEDKAVCTVCGQAYGELAAHVYDQSVAEQTYLKSEATCQDAAVYYKSCECGAFDSGATAATFVSGTPTSVHTPEADDGDCTTAIECSVCGDETTAAKSHAYDNACDATCNNEGCTAGNRTTNHTPEADDNDCTTAIECSECGAETTAAKSHAYDNACDTTCNNEGCTAGNRTTNHAPNQDDGNCTTPITCSICGAETTAAKRHTPSADWGQDSLSHWQVCADCDKNFNLAAHTGGEATCTAGGTCEDCGYEYLPATGHTFEGFVCDCGLDVLEEVFGVAGVSIAATEGTVSAAQDGSIVYSGGWWVRAAVTGLTIPQYATHIKLTMKTDITGYSEADGGVWHKITGTKDTANASEAMVLTGSYVTYEIPLTGGAGEALTTLDFTAQNSKVYLSKVEFTIVEPDPDPDTNTDATHINFSSENVTLGACTNATSSLKQDVDGRTYLEVIPTSGDPWWNGAVVNFTDDRENTNVKTDGTYTKVKIGYKIVGGTNPDGLSLRLLGVDGANNVVNTGPDGTTDGYINLASVAGASAGWVEAEFDIKYANPQTITGLDFGVKGYMPTICIDYIEFLTVKTPSMSEVMNNVFGSSDVSVTATAGTVSPAVDGSLAFGSGWWVNATVSGLTIPENATEMKLTMKANKASLGGVYYNITGVVGSSGGDGDTLTLTDQFVVYTLSISNGMDGTAITMFNLCVQNNEVCISKIEFTIDDSDPNAPVADPDTDTSATHINFSEANVTLGEGTLTTSSLKQDADGRTYLEVTPTAGDPWWNGAVVNFTDNRANTNVKANGTYTKIKICYKIVGGTNPDGLSLRLLGVDGANNVVNTGPDGTTDGYINLASVEGASAGWVEATFDIKYANPQTITGLDFGVKGYMPTICIDYIEFIVE